MGLEEIGAILKAQREDKGISLVDISEETMIPVKQLRALEEGNTKPFPAEVYVRGALKNYARAVGLDSRELMKIYGDEDKGTKKPENIGKPENKQEVTSFYTKKPGFWSRALSFFSGKSMVTLLFAAAVFILALGIIYGNTDIIGDAPGERPENDRKANALDPANEEYQNNDEAAQERMEDPEEEVGVVLVEESAEQLTYRVQGVEQIEVNLEFTDRCWVKYVVEEETSEGMYEAGQELDIPASEDVWIRLGLPPSVEVAVNGKPLDNERLKESSAVNLELVIGDDENEERNDG